MRATTDARHFVGRPPKKPTLPYGHSQFWPAMRRYVAARIAWRLRYAARRDRDHGCGGPKDDRERAFCRVLVRELVMAAAKNGGKVTRADREIAASTATREAGYPERSDAAVAQRGLEQSALPRIKLGIEAEFADHGLTLDIAAERMKRIITGGEDDVALKAIALLIQTTVGFAPTKTANLHAVAMQPDRIFSQDRFAKVPPIITIPGPSSPKPKP